MLLNLNIMLLVAKRLFRGPNAKIMALISFLTDNKDKCSVPAKVSGIRVDYMLNRKLIAFGKNDCATSPLK